MYICAELISMWTYDFGKNTSRLCGDIKILASDLNPTGDTVFHLEFMVPEDRMFEVGTTSRATITVEGTLHPDVEGGTCI